MDGDSSEEGGGGGGRPSFWKDRGVWLSFDSEMEMEMEMESGSECSALPTRDDKLQVGKKDLNPSKPSMLMIARGGQCSYKS